MFTVPPDTRVWYTTYNFVWTYGCAENVCWAINMTLPLSSLSRSRSRISDFSRFSSAISSPLFPGGRPLFLRRYIFSCRSVYCLARSTSATTPLLSLSRLWQLHNFNARFEGIYLPLTRNTFMDRVTSAVDTFLKQPACILHLAIRISTYVSFKRDKGTYERARGLATKRSCFFIFLFFGAFACEYLR